jgi:hypothetical protein
MLAFLLVITSWTLTLLHNWLFCCPCPIHPYLALSGGCCRPLVTAPHLLLENQGHLWLSWGFRICCLGWESFILDMMSSRKMFCFSVSLEIVISKLSVLFHAGKYEWVLLEEDSVLTHSICPTFPALESNHGNGPRSSYLGNQRWGTASC